MKVKSKLLSCNHPSPYTGRVYPKHEVERAVERYRESINAGIAIGELGIQGTDAINLTHASHKVIDLFFEGDDLYAEVEFLQTGPGQVAQLMLKTDVGRLSPVMYATINEDGTTAKDVGIVKTAIVPNEPDTTESPQ